MNFKDKKMKTTANRIIVLPKQQQQTTTVLLTDDTTPLLGEVVAVGVKAEKEGYRSGSVVMFNRFSGTDFEHDGRKFKAITSIDILKIL